MLPQFVKRTVYVPLFPKVIFLIMVIVYHSDDNIYQYVKFACGSQPISSSVCELIYIIGQEYMESEVGDNCHVDDRSALVATPNCFEPFK